MIRFKCPACDAPFEVDERNAGRVARCKGCGARMKIPAATTAAPARPRPVAVAAAARSTPQPAAVNASSRGSSGPGRPTSWRDAVTSQIALAPISADGMPAIRRKYADLDEPSVPGPYRLDSAPSLPALETARSRGRAAGSVTIGYRQGMGKVQKLFRWINESAYLVSVPFVMMLILGIAFHSRSLAILGATGVVILNIGRLFAGLANLVVIPFRDSPIQGILFLIPPITFFYLAQNWEKVRKPVMRIAGPIFTVGLVILAFTFEPWLRGGESVKGSFGSQLRAGAKSVKEAVKGEVEKIPGVDVDKLEGLAPKAVEALRNNETLKNIRGSDAVKSLESSEVVKSIESGKAFENLGKRVGEAGKMIRSKATGEAGKAPGPQQ